jgi:hypothetical protein
MAEIGHLEDRRTRSVGDAAVDGLFGGLAAGILMGAYLFFVGVTEGVPASDVLKLLVGMDEIGPTSAVLMHLAISGIYGVLFGIGIYLSRLDRQARTNIARLSLIGLGFGLALAVIARYLLLPGSGSIMESLSRSTWSWHT